MNFGQLFNAVLLKDLQPDLGPTDEKACDIANPETQLVIKAILGKLVRCEAG